MVGADCLFWISATTLFLGLRPKEQGRQDKTLGKMVTFTTHTFFSSIFSWWLFHPQFFFSMLFHIFHVFPKFFKAKQTKLNMCVKKVKFLFFSDPSINKKVQILQFTTWKGGMTPQKGGVQAFCALFQIAFFLTNKEGGRQANVQKMQDLHAHHIGTCS